MTDENPCGIESEKLKEILAEKKGRLSRSIGFEKNFQQKYGLNDMSTVEDMEKELHAVEALEETVCGAPNDWCRKKEQPKPVPEPEPVEPVEEKRD